MIETFLSGLIAPVMMIFQSSAVGEILLGRDAGWQVQRRDDGKWPVRELIRKYAVPTLFGAAMAVSAYAVSLPLLLWMAPVILGLLLSIPIAMLSSMGSDPNSLILRTPEQAAPPPILTRANELGETYDEAAASPLLALCNDAVLLDAHLTNLPGDRPRNRGQINPQLAIARAKIEDAQTLDDALSYLTAPELFAVLNSPNMLTAVLGLPRGQERA